MAHSINYKYIILVINDVYQKIYYNKELYSTNTSKQYVHESQFYVKNNTNNKISISHIDNLYYIYDNKYQTNLKLEIYGYDEEIITDPVQSVDKENCILIKSFIINDFNLIFKNGKHNNNMYNYELKYANTDNPYITVQVNNNWMADLHLNNSLYYDDSFDNNSYNHKINSINF